MNIDRIVNENPLIKLGYDQLKENQKVVIKECLELGSGSMFLPMGYGKTIISLILPLIQRELNKEKIILFVLSKTLIINLIAEIKKFFGDELKYDVLHSDYIDVKKWNVKNDIIITTSNVLSKYYTSLNIDLQFIKSEWSNQYHSTIKKYMKVKEPLLHINEGVPFLYSNKLSVLITDESQGYYNMDRPKGKCIASLCVVNRWLLSGTMIEEPKIEKIFGYYLLLNLKGIPRNKPAFENYIRKDSYKGLRSTMVLREKNEEFEPPKINSIIVTNKLTFEEIMIYENTKKVLFKLNKLQKKYKQAGDKENSKKFSSFKMAMLTHLRESIICPLVPITNIAISVSFCNKRNELANIFMESLHELDLSDWLNDIESLKSSRIKKMLERIEKHKDDKIIIFSCYRFSLNILASFIENRELFTIESNHNIERRKKSLDDFSNSKNGIMLLTYDIGANGLNLQCCSTVFIADFFWNDGKRAQSIARIIRPGQLSKSVNVYYFTSNTGIENAIFKSQKCKIETFEKLLDGKFESDLKTIKIDNIIKLLEEEDNLNLLTSILKF